MNGESIRKSPIEFFIETDASKNGWGAYFNGKFVRGRWSSLECTNQINVLKLFAIFLAFKSFFSSNTCTMYHHIGIKSDNSSAVAYINNMGGMTSQSMDQLAIDNWNCCTGHHLFISAQYLPSVLNSNADFMSRVFSNNWE